MFDLLRMFLNPQTLMMILVAVAASGPSAPPASSRHR